jgi:predicted nucleic acid-binding protein
MPCVVDTNVLVYSVVENSPFHAASRTRIEELESSGIELCTTAQVLREYVSVVTRATVMTEPRTPAEAVTDVRSLARRFRLLRQMPGCHDRWLDLVARYGLTGAAVHDAYVVAVALESAVDSVLTNNVSHFAAFEEIRTLPLVPDR